MPINLAFFIIGAVWIVASSIALHYFERSHGMEDSQ